MTTATDRLEAIATIARCRGQILIAEEIEEALEELVLTSTGTSILAEREKDEECLRFAREQAERPRTYGDIRESCLRWLEEQAPERAADVRATFVPQIPAPPTLGGGSTPEEHLRWRAEQDRTKGANTRAREAEAIADWIAQVRATLSPPVTEPSDAAEKKEDGGPEQNPVFSDHPSRACLRGELEAIVSDAQPISGVPSSTVDAILERLARARPVWGSGDSWRDCWEKTLASIRDGKQ